VEPDALFDTAWRGEGGAIVAELFSGSRLASWGVVDEASVLKGFEAMRDGGAFRFDPWWSITAEMWLRRHWP
jgi:hypothetical protein